MPIKPTPNTWTLRFKHSRTTILLHADPNQSLSDLKTDLLRALQETLPDQTLNDQPLPSDPSAILLAKPLDPSDLNQGWHSIETSNADDIIDEDEGKSSAGKGKGKARVGMKATPQSAGLRDGSAVAFRFQSTKAENGADVDVVGNSEVGAQEWDVVVPKYEDVFEGMQTDAELEEQARREAEDATAAAAAAIAARER